MEELELQFPTEQHRERAEEFKREFFEAGEPVINGSALLDQLEYADWLAKSRSNRNPQTVHDDWVVASTFFAVRKRDEKIIGMIDVRHSLDNDFLAKYGGHIGYAVRPTERQKGYATQMLRLALAYSKSLGIARVMLGCYSANTASIKTIEKCGGVCVETKPYADGEPMRIYWIEIGDETVLR